MAGYDLCMKILTRVQVDPQTGCWLWTGAHSQSGWRGVFYPAVRVRERVWRVNRLVLMLYQGPVDLPRQPREPILVYLDRLRAYYHGLEASHRCDRALCICPRHLEWKSHRANIQEQVDRRRQTGREAA